MRKTLLLAATAAATLAATPAAARDGQPYFGVSGGILFPKDQDIDLVIDPVGTVDPTVSLDNAIGIDYKRGYDLDLNLGYDFGIFRLEGELGYKRAKLDNLELSPAARTALEADFGPIDTETDLDLDGRASVQSAMLNGLIDIGGNDGIGFFAGGGVGRARVKFVGERDTAWAYQLLAGVRAPISDNIDVGLKYRYFRTARLSFIENEALIDDGQIGTVFGTAENRFRSHSLLANLTFNFGGRSEPVAVIEPVAAPVVEAAPPPPPATQTCPDGSVILATDVCPVPPPPPPPPAETVERG